MSRLKWDQTGERKYETGTKKGVLYVQNGSSYNEGVAWNGLTAVTESPSGAEANDMWADNIKYGSLRSAETFGGTIEAYTYPDEFKPCNGENELIPGVSLGQQKRNPFAFSYVSDVGNDTPTEDDDGYKIHIIYNATASPAEKGYTTVNDSPEAITFSWEISTTPIDVPGFKPTASLEIDTTNLSEYQRALGCLEEIEDTLYGTETTDATLMLPSEVAEALEINVVDAEFTYQDEEETIINGMTLPDLTDVNRPILVIPEGVTEIANAAGKNKVGNIVYIDLPDSVTSIDNSAFYNCRALTSLTIPDSVTSIGNSAFFNCYALTSLTIPNSVTSIGEFTFANCQALTSLTTPDSVTSISRGAFSDCYALTSLTIGNSVTSIGEEMFANCHSLASLTLGNSVTSIGNRAFGSCRVLTALTIPDSVTSIGNSAFNNCYALTSLTIPNSVTSIDDGAFSSCYALTSLTIPNSVTSIGRQAFSSCHALTSLTIPNSVTSIGDGAFSGCQALTSLTIPNSVTSIGIAAFQECLALTSLTIPNSVTSIGNGAFQECEALTSLTLGNSVTSIGRKAFYSCDALTSLTIPNSVTSIGAQAFIGCNVLTTVDLTAFDGTTVPELGDSYAFHAETHPEGFKFVFSSQEALDAFTAATNWSEYTDYFEIAS